MLGRLQGFLLSLFLLPVWLQRLFPFEASHSQEVDGVSQSLDAPGTTTKIRWKETSTFIPLCVLSPVNNASAVIARLKKRQVVFYMRRCRQFAARRFIAGKVAIVSCLDGRFRLVVLRLFSPPFLPCTDLSVETKLSLLLRVEKKRR